MTTMDKIIYWGTLVLAWALLPIAMLWVGLQTAITYSHKTIDDFER